MGIYNNENSPLMLKSTAFATRVTNMVNWLQTNSDKKFGAIFNQVLRSGTSIMANVGESQFAQSKNDFINKLHVALKEASETRRWIVLLHNSKCLSDSAFDSMYKDNSELVAMLVSSLNTAKKNKIIEEQNGAKVKSKSVKDDNLEVSET